jgi:hypothetical protein
MSLGSILLGLALFIVVALVLAYPYLVAQRQEMPSEYERLEAAKELLLGEIRILDFDHETGKIPTESYEAERRGLVAEAARIMQKLDDLPQPRHRPDLDLDDLDDADDLEAAIAALRQKGKPRQPQGKGKKASSPTPVVAAAAPVAPSNGRFCTECGQSVKSSDKFCASCGHKLAG